MYLRVKLSKDGKMESEVEKKIGMTMQSVGEMKKVYESRGVSREAKVTVFKAVAMPTLIYGCGAWFIREREKSRIQAMEMGILRMIVSITRLDHMRNELVRKRLSDYRRSGWKKT